MVFKSYDSNQIIRSECGVFGLQSSVIYVLQEISRVFMRLQSKMNVYITANTSQ